MCGLAGRLNFWQAQVATIGDELFTIVHTSGGIEESTR
jgi:hypothetical protein